MGRAAIPIYETIGKNGRPVVPEGTWDQQNTRLEAQRVLVCGDGQVDMPPALLADPYAVQVWEWLVAQYQDATWVRSSDVPTMEKYCRNEAEYRRVTEAVASLRGGDPTGNLVSVLQTESAGLYTRLEKITAVSMRLSVELLLTPQARARAAAKVGKNARVKSRLENAGFEGI